MRNYAVSIFQRDNNETPSTTPPPSDSLQRSYVVFENTCRECLPCERDDFPPVIAQDKYAFDVKYASDTFFPDGMVNSQITIFLG